MKFKKGDQVIVTVGKDKGKKGAVERVLPKAHAVVVAGVGVFKRHRKKRDEQHPAGIADIIKPIDSAKVALVCPKCGKVTRIGYRIIKGAKERMCKKCEQVV